MAVWFYALGSVVLGWLILERVVAYVVAVGTATATAIGALFIAYLMYPTVRRLNVRMPLWAAIAIPYLSCTVAIALCLWLSLPRLVTEAESLIGAAPQFEQAFRTYVAAPSDPILLHVPAEVRAFIADIPERTVVYLRTNMFGVSEWFFATARSAVNLGVLIVAIPVVSIYMLAEAEGIKRLFLGMIPERTRGRATNVMGELSTAVGGYVRGQLIVAGTVGFLASALLLGLHVPYGLLIGVWAGLADIIPYVGPFVGGIPAVAVAVYANGAGGGLLVGGGFVLINQIEAHLLLPRIIAKTVNISPLTVIFALIVGGELFGIAGLLVAVPIAGALRVLLQNVRPPETLTNAQVQPSLTQLPQVEVDPDATHT